MDCAPENTMKFVVGIMLTSFGAFWVGEGLHVHWAQKDASILYIVLSLLILSWILVTRSRSGRSVALTIKAVRKGSAECLFHLK